MHRRVLWKWLFRLFLVKLQRLGQRVIAFTVNFVEHLGIKTRHVHRVIHHKAQVDLGRGRSSDLIAQIDIASVVHADIEYGTGTTPIGVL